MTSHKFWDFLTFTLFPLSHLFYLGFINCVTKVWTPLPLFRWRHLWTAPYIHYPTSNPVVHNHCSGDQKHSYLKSLEITLLKFTFSSFYAKRDISFEVWSFFQNFNFLPQCYHLWLNFNFAILMKRMCLCC